MNRREFIRQGAAVIGGTIFAGCSGKFLNGADKMTKKPNILFITTDQQYAKLMSCAGELNAKTPNLDKLAASGVRFENAYCANPVCVPSRYSLTTGYMPHVFGELEHNMKKNKKDLPEIKKYINTPAMGHIFRSAGYETVYGGKLHVEQFNNYEEAAEETFGFKCLTGDTKGKLAKKCSEFIKKKHDKPFLMWASFINPHDICDGFPFMGYNDMDHPYTQKCHKKMNDLHDKHPGIPFPDMPENFLPSTDDPLWIKKFREGILENTGLNSAFGSHAIHWTEKMWKEYRWVYRRYMESVDKQIGKVLKALKESGLEEETIVIFTSDHGDHDGAHGLTMKRSFYEESSNIPLLISWKNNIESNVVDKSSLVNNGIDMIPTMCDLAGINPPENLKGKSFNPLSNEKNKFVVSETVGGRMLRTLQYKYNIYYVAGKSEEQLFDMEKDKSEKKNLAKLSDYNSILEKHREILKDWTIANKDKKGQKYLKSLKT